MLKKIIKIILVLLCMITIFTFSSDSADESTKKSDGLIVRISEFLVGHRLSPEERQERIDKYVTIIRKGAHLTIYLILGFLLISLVKEYRQVDIKALLIALLIAILYACSDEIHQLFVSERSGKFTDVLVDSIGIIIPLIIVKVFRRRNIYD